MINNYLAICLASLRYGVHRSIYAPSSLIRLIDSVISPYLILPSVPTTIPTIRVTIVRTTIIGHTSLLIRLLRSASLQRFSSIRFCMCKSRLLLHHIDYRVALYTIPIVIFGDVLNRPIRYVKSTFNHSCVGII